MTNFTDQQLVEAIVNGLKENSKRFSKLRNANGARRAPAAKSRRRAVSVANPALVKAKRRRRAT